MFKKSMATLLLGCVALMANGEVAIKSGEKVSFLGDSITYLGAGSPVGYCRLVESALAGQGLENDMVFAGISGHKSNQMLARLESDILSNNPNWMFLSCGVNDVWHGKDGVTLPDYRKNITDIIDQAQAKGVKVVILSSTMIHENAENDFNRKLDDYNKFLAEIAQAKGCLFADLNAPMKSYIANAKQRGQQAGTLLTVDGVHMNPTGNVMMATEILKTIGFSDEQLATAQAQWESNPEAWVVNGRAGLTISEFEKLNTLASKNGITVQAQSNILLKKSIDNL